MKISIVVLNWNRKSDTIQCLDSIAKLQVPDFKAPIQIIVVDNASTDNSQKEIKRALKVLNEKADFECELIINKKNLGFAEGNNVGIKHAINHDADYVLILNNDTVIDSKMVFTLLECAKKYPKSGVISPKIYFAKGYEFRKERYKLRDLGNVIWYAGGAFDWNNIYGLNRGVDEVDKSQYDDVKELEFATGACMFVRATALKEVGLFDPKYYMYLEDVDLSVRLKKAGWKILYCPDAILWHKVAQSSQIGSELNDYFIIRNRLIFGMRYAKFRTRLALYRESQRLFWKGRYWQKRAVIDYYLRRFGRGSWNDKN